jgi:hypothetical protein
VFYLRLIARGEVFYLRLIARGEVFYLRLIARGAKTGAASGYKKSLTKWPLGGP